jgi:hypothetical protein
MHAITTISAPPCGYKQSTAILCQSASGNERGTKQLGAPAYPPIQTTPMAHCSLYAMPFCWRTRRGRRAFRTHRSSHAQARALYSSGGTFPCTSPSRPQPPAAVNSPARSHIIVRHSAAPQSSATVQRSSALVLRSLSTGRAAGSIEQLFSDRPTDLHELV